MMKMKKIVTVIVCVYFSLLVVACTPPDEGNLDPRSESFSTYNKKLRDLSKAYDKLYSRYYDPEKSFDLFLSYFLMKSDNAYTKDNCAQAIEDNFEKFDLIFFKADTKKKLKSFCDYNIKSLMALGDQYLEKSQDFDYNTLTAMHLYYNVHSKSLDEAIDNDNYSNENINIGKNSYNKFKSLRKQLSKNYIDLANYIPFDRDGFE